MTRITYLALGVAFMAGCSAAPMTEDTAATEQAVTTCATMGGVFPTKAALAVAMGIELQRFQPSKDLKFNGYSSNVTLNSTASCKVNNCRNTKAILGLQGMDYSKLGGAQVFDSTTYKTELINGFAAQTTLNNLLPSKGKPQPPDHKATLLSGPTDLGTQACGKQYVFDITTTSGAQLTASQQSAMIYWFCYFGQAPEAAIGYQCGNNPYVGFAQTNVGCPAGHFCITIDPDYGDQGTPSTTSGAAPTYPQNRVYAPDDVNFHLNKSELINTPCTKLNGVAGTLLTKSSTPDYLFCQ